MNYKSNMLEIETYGNEREIGISSPELVFNTILDNLELKNETFLITKAPYVNVTVICDKEGNLFYGTGKGTQTQSRNGANFEALEHYFSSTHSMNENEIILKPTNSIPEFISIPHIINFFKLSNKLISCFKYISLTDKNQQINFFPSYLSFPSFSKEIYDQKRENFGDFFEYNKIVRYVSNSGTAIGLKIESALVHSINEIVERDSFSIFLIRAFLTNNYRIKIISPVTLPDDIAKYHRQIENRFQTKVIIIELENDLGFPCYMTWTNIEIDSQFITGYGCSLSSSYAIFRALAEITQGASKYPDFLEKKGVDLKLDKLNNYPKLKRCACIDLNPLLKKSITIPFKKKGYDLKTPKEHLNFQRNTLKKNGFKIWYREHSTAKKEGVSHVHVIIPKMENFFLITYGNIVIPSPRGLTIAGLI